MVTEQEARDMQTAIDTFENKDERDRQDQFNIDKGIAETWFNTLGIDIQGALTRDQALINYRNIQGLLVVATNRFRIIVLKEKLIEAENKFLERKKNG